MEGRSAAEGGGRKRERRPHCTIYNVGFPAHQVLYQQRPLQKVINPPLDPSVEKRKHEDWEAICTAPHPGWCHLKCHRTHSISPKKH